MEVIFKGDLLVMKIKITYLILSPLVICYFGPILIFDLDHFFGDLPYLWYEALKLFQNHKTKKLQWGAIAWKTIFASEGKLFFRFMQLATVICIIQPLVHQASEAKELLFFDEKIYCRTLFTLVEVRVSFF